MSWARVRRNQWRGSVRSPPAPCWRRHLPGCASGASITPIAPTCGMCAAGGRTSNPNSRTLARFWHPRTGTTPFLLLPSTTTELVVLNLIPQHDPQPDPELASHGHAGNSRWPFATRYSQANFCGAVSIAICMSQAAVWNVTSCAGAVQSRAARAKEGFRRC